MSAFNSDSNQSCCSDDDRIGNTVNSFVDTVVAILSQTNADSEAIKAIETAGNELGNKIQRLEETTDQQQKQIDDNAETIEDEKSRRSAEIEGCHNRLSRLDDKIDPNNNGEAGESADNPESKLDETTALERVCALPEHVVQNNLTANQRRARSVARRINEYGKAVPAGIAITSSRIKRVLTAQEDSTIRRQTVKRVAQFLQDFGDGEVEIKETRGGKTTVVFKEDLVDNVTSVVTDNRDDGVTAATI